MDYLTSFISYVYDCLLAGSSETPNERRREFILHVILLSTVLACIIAAILAAVDYPPQTHFRQGNTVYNTSALAVIMVALYYLSKNGKQLIAAYMFLGTVGLAVLSVALRWSYELPTAELGCALLIILASMILSTRSAVRWCLSIAILFLSIATAQIFGVLYSDTSWLKHPLQLSNAIDYGLILGVITIVALLANMELGKAFARAKRSRDKVLFERDQLELRVAERTAEIERIQTMHLLELQRYAEFGRMNANLLHEITSPLAAASLNLQQLGKADLPALKQARKSLGQLERYVQTARKQLQHQSQLSEFEVRREIKQLFLILKPLADKAHVKLRLDIKTPIILYGDPVRFNQIIANLVTNAIDAYTETLVKNAAVTISVEDLGRYLKVSVADKGAGISAVQLPQIFQPFYTTKQGEQRGLGIGLSIVKQSVKNDFKGTICVNSSPDRGTVFTLLLKFTQRAT